MREKGGTLTWGGETGTPGVRNPVRDMYPVGP